MVTLVGNTMKLPTHTQFFIPDESKPYECLAM